MQERKFIYLRHPSCFRIRPQKIPCPEYGCENSSTPNSSRYAHKILKNPQTAAILQRFTNMSRVQLILILIKVGLDARVCMM